MKDPIVKNGGGAYENKYESGDFSFEFKFERPKFTEKIPKKIHKFYEKKLKRAESYYRDSFLHCAKKYTGKRRSEYDFPDTILVSHKITDSCDKYISVLRKTEFFYNDRSVYVVFSEVWSLPDCRLLFMGDLSGAGYITERRLLRGVYSLCLDSVRFELYQDLKPRLRRNLHRENVYIKDSRAYIFFQPGALAPAKYGIISLPLDSAIKACSSPGKRKVKGTLNKSISAGQ